MNIFFVFTILLACIQFTKQINDTQLPKDNLILDFHFDGLDEFVKQYKYVMVFFNDIQTRQGKKNQKKYINVAKHMQASEIVFVQVQTSQIKEELLEDYKQKYPVSLYLFIYSIKKPFHQKIDEEDLINWTTNIYSGQVEKFESIEKLQQEINFVYINDIWYEKNKTHIEILSKLIFPVKIFTSLPKEILDHLQVKEDTPLWLLQSYSNKILPIDINYSLQKKAKFILKNEFPNYMIADENNYKILFDLKIPSALYFTPSIKRDKRVVTLKKIARKYKDYFLLTIVETRKKTFYTKFFKKFLNVKNTPSLRILNMTDKVQRYKFHGQYKTTLVDNFFQNYVHDNLKPFNLNEDINYGEKLYGIPKANYNKFKKIQKDEDVTYVVFVYGQDTSELVRQLEELDIVQDILRKNKTLKFYCIDHDSNDLDGYYNNQLPFMFIADRLGKLHHYEDKFVADKMLVFINSVLPYLENSEPSFDFATSDLQLNFVYLF